MQTLSLVNFCHYGKSASNILVRSGSDETMPILNPFSEIKARPNLFGKEMI